MTEDLLNKLGAALAETYDGAHVAPDLTRARVLDRLAGRRTARRSRLFILGPLLGLGLGATALAASNSGWFLTVQTPSASAAVTVALSQPRVLGAAPPRPLLTAAPAPKEVASTPTAEVRDSGAPILSRARPFQTLGVAKKAPKSVLPAVSELGLDLFRRAHDAHFKARDYRTALVGYRAYLRAHRGGALALEASYNAALCEAHLGLREAARHSLTPFARGSYGGYRQGEALRLLEALSDPEHGTP